MDFGDIRRKKIIETSADLRGYVSDILPEEIFRGICMRWIPELSTVKVPGTLFLEHGYDLRSILEFLASELVWGTENNGYDIRNIPEQRKWNLLYTLESLSLCHASNVLTWSVCSEGVRPQLETTPWRTGPEKNWYDYDIEPTDSYNLNEKLDPLKIPVYPIPMDAPSRYFIHKDRAIVGTVMGDALCTATGLTERMSVFGEHLPVRPFNDSGIGKWGGMPTFISPFESDTPPLSSSPVISKIQYPEEKVKTAAAMFVAKKEEIREIYGYMMDSLAAYIDEQSAPEVPVPHFGKDERDVTPERCRRFAAFFRFTEMDMWKNFDYIMKTYRIQSESQYSIKAANKGQENSFARIDISDSPPKAGQLLLGQGPGNGLPADDLDCGGDPMYTEFPPERESKETSEDNVAYDGFAAPVIWKKFNIRKKAMVRSLAVKTLCDLKRQYEDIMVEISALEECIKRGSFADFDNIRSEKGLLMNSRTPTQKFFCVECFVPLKASEVAVTFNEDVLGQAAREMIKAGKQKADELVRSAFSKKEQEDHLRGIAMALHSLICLAVDAAEGRNVLKDWSADIYSTIQEHSVNDAMLPRDRNSAEFKEILRRHGKLAKFISPVDFSKIREGVKFSRYGKDIGGSDSGITTFGEWSQLEQMTPSPGFRPFVERADGLSLRQLIRHGISGTPLQNGLTRDNSRYILAPRIAKWRLRSTLIEAAKIIRDKAAGDKASLLTVHVDDPSKLPAAREAVLEFVLSFCDAFAKEAHRSKMDLFNDTGTREILDRMDTPEARLAMLKTASGSWGLSGTGLYLKEKQPPADDRSFFEKAAKFAGEEIDNNKSEKLSDFLINTLSVMSYAKEFINVPRVVRLGLLDPVRYYSRLSGLNHTEAQYIPLNMEGVAKGDFTNAASMIFGNMLRENSQYMPLLKVLEYPKDPFSGTYIYNVNLENRDIMHTDSYIKLFGLRGLTKGKGTDLLCYDPADVRRLPMGAEKWGWQNSSVMSDFSTAVDNMMRMAWHGNEALMASRTFRDVISRGVMGYEAMYGTDRTQWPAGTPAASNGRMGSIEISRPYYIQAENGEYINKGKKERIPAVFIKNALPAEEMLELIDSYTISEKTHDIYMDKHRILKYSALDPKYMFMTLFQPVRRYNSRILVNSLEPFPHHGTFGYASFAYERGSAAGNVSDEYLCKAENYRGRGNYAYFGEAPMVPSPLLIDATLRQISRDGSLRREYDALKEQTFSKEWIIARSGNDREDRNWESARMRCLMRDIGYTVRKIREADPEMPLTVMSAAAMDPLARMGEPEVRMESVSESVKQAELSSILRKAYWGADFHNIRKHLNINNTRFFEDEENPGGCLRKLSARFAFQYEFLKNADFLKERYSSADRMINAELCSRNPGEDPRWRYRDLVYQNCASLTVKRDMRAYFKNAETEILKEFDDTNLLRAAAFSITRPLDRENRDRAALIYPGSAEYPKYQFGMEYYRSNIPKQEFVAWIRGAYEKYGYFINDRQEYFLTDNGSDWDETSYGILPSGRNVHGAPDHINSEYIQLYVGKEVKMFSPEEFRRVDKKDAVKWVRDSWIRNVYTADKLDPAMNGEITAQNVPFLAEMMGSEIISKLFERQADRDLSKSDYYPSVDETAVMTRSFESGMAGLCRRIGIDIKIQGEISSADKNFADEPPCWLDTGER